MKVVKTGIAKSRSVQTTMVEKIEEGKRVKCPWCAEQIMPEALICPFCRSKVTSLPVTEKNTGADKPADSRPGMLRAMILNLVCPGMGAWKLGYKTRGAVVFVLVLAGILVYTAEVVPVIQKEVEIAFRTGRTAGLMQLEADLKDNAWLEVTFYIYLLSFVDIFFLIRNAKKTDPGSGS